MTNCFDLLNSPLEGRNLIEASAGTGKTYTIAGLYLRLLLEKRLSVDQILVVTFTVAATEELRARIRRRIREALAAFVSINGSDQGASVAEPTPVAQSASVAEPAPVTQPAPVADDFLAGLVKKCADSREAELLLTNALRCFDEAVVFTIHGFCQKTLQEKAFECGSFFNTELITDQSGLMQEVVDDFWRIHAYNASPEFINFAGKRWSLKAITTLVRTCASRLNVLRVIPEADFWETKGSQPTPVAVDYLEMEGPQPDTVEEDACIRALDQMRLVWPIVREEVEDLLVNSGQSLNQRKYPQASIRGWMETMDKYLTPANSPPRWRLFPYPGELEKFGITALEGAVKKGCQPPRHQFFILADDLHKKLKELEAVFEQRLLALKRKLLDFVREELPRRKHEQNIRSFDDLLLSLQIALKGEGGADLAQVIREKYRAALIDEFQDTDPIQYDIFKTIYPDRKSTLFLIGDPKQAIYSFRGADIFAYLEAAKDVEARYTLGTNWRSVPDLIRAVNAIFSNRDNPFIFEDIPFRPVNPPPVLGRGGEGEGQIVPLSPHPPVPPSPITNDAPLQLWFIAARPGDSQGDLQHPTARPARSSGKKINKEEAKKQLPEAVASEIGRLLKAGQQGQALIDCHRGGLGRHVTPGDIAVLVRTNDQASTMQEALRRRGIPSVLYSSESLFTSREAAELLTVLIAVAEPGSEEKIKAALVTDMMGISGNELAGLITARPCNEALPCDEGSHSENGTLSESGIHSGSGILPLETGSAAHASGEERPGSIVEAASCRLKYEIAVRPDNEGSNNSLIPPASKGHPDSAARSCGEGSPCRDGNPCGEGNPCGVDCGSETVIPVRLGNPEFDDADFKEPLWLEDCETARLGDLATPPCPPLSPSPRPPVPSSPPPPLEGMWLEKFKVYHELWARKQGFMIMASTLIALEKVRSRLLAYQDGERRVTNLLHCLEVLHQAAMENNLGIDGLVKWFTRQINENPEKEEYQIRLETDEKAVKLVTIHKSKGLEYPIVFCPFCWSGVREEKEMAFFHDPENGHKTTLVLGSQNLLHGGNRKNTVVSGQKTVDSDQSLVGSRQKTVASDQLSVISGQKSSASDQSSVGNGQKTVASDQSSVGSGQEESVTSSQKSVANGNAQATVFTGDWPAATTLESTTLESAKSLARKEILAEDLRLLYVALTRARYRCYLVWGVIGRAEASAPAYLLHPCPCEGDKKVDNPVDATVAWLSKLDNQKMLDDLDALAQKAKGAISVCAVPDASSDIYEAVEDYGDRLSCRTFSGSIPDDWHIASFSSLVSGREEWSEGPCGAAARIGGAGSTCGREGPGLDESHPFEDDGGESGPTVPLPLEAVRPCGRGGPSRSGGWVGAMSAQDAGLKGDARDAREAVEDEDSPQSSIDFPRGTRAGTCLHAILEGLDFAERTPDATKKLVQERLVAHGFDQAWAPAVYSMLDRVLTTPLMDGREDFTLSSLTRRDRVEEMEFYFPLERITSKGLSKVFEAYSGPESVSLVTGAPCPREDKGSTVPLPLVGGGRVGVMPNDANKRITIPKGFVTMLEKLNFTPARGLLKGYIDLVFRFEGRYYLADYKSNYLGPRIENYAAAALTEVMEREYYLLQYHLYTVALHKYLARRVSDYDYQTHFGGAFYVFLRGVDPAHGPGFGIYRDRPAKSLIDGLDRYFSGAK